MCGGTSIWKFQARSGKAMLDLRSVQADALSFDVATVSYSGARACHDDQLVSSFPLGQESGFSVLADGIGSDDFSAVASALVLSETFSQLKMKENMLADGLLSVPDTLRDVLDAANARLAGHIASDQDSNGMGSTLLTTYIWQNKLYWLSVGDSSLLLFRDGALRPLNQFAVMPSQTAMKAPSTQTVQDAGHAARDRGTRQPALFGGPIATVDCPDRPVALMPDDIVIAANRGLQEFLSQEVIVNALKAAGHGHGVDIANALLDALHQSEHPQKESTAIVVIKLNEDMRNSIGADATDFAAQPLAAENTKAEGPIARQLAQSVRRAQPAGGIPKLSVVAKSYDASEDIPIQFYRRQK